MLIARALVLVLMALAILCFVGYIFTGNPRLRTWGSRLLRWTLVAALVFFGTLIITKLL